MTVGIAGPQNGSVTRIGSCADRVSALWQTFDSGRTRPLRWRLAQLDGLTAFLRDNERDILDALFTDLGKPEFEGFASDVGAVILEIKTLRKNLPRQLRPRRVRTPLTSRPARSYLYPEPLGVVLVTPAWNYPVGLAVLPAAGALAAGNAVALKTSEVAPTTASLMMALLPNYLDRQAFDVFLGGPEVAEELLQERYGHIHYTGNSRVGRSVMRAASATLTPVTLELGGKNPVYVHRDADIATAARRIMWGRMFNAGQTCLSPDYVLAHRSIKRQLLAEMKKWIAEAYGSDPQVSPDLARIVNDRHFDRVIALLDGAGEIVAGGKFERATRYVAPTIVDEPDLEHPLMTEEIFGPIIAVLGVDDPAEAVAFVAARAQPLSAYVFTGDDDVVAMFTERTSSGSLVINHVFMHAFNANLPFGGVGESGMGTYTGKHSFDCFTHWKPLMRIGLKPDPPILYPPYSRWKSVVTHLMFR